MLSRTGITRTLVLAARQDIAPHPSTPTAPDGLVLARGPAWENGRILFSSNRDASTLDVDTMNPDGSGMIRLTATPDADEEWAVWSPDGQRVAFASTRDEPNVDIHVLNADATGVVRVTSSVGLDIQPSWSTDGTRLVFATGRQCHDGSH